MNLDETIKYYKKQAERDRILIESAETMPPSSVDYQMLDAYRESESNHKQVVKWLTELKQWKENPFEVIDDYCSKIDDCVECDFIDCCPNRGGKVNESLKSHS